MKLINKLLPIATIAGVTAIVAPMATSCASGSLIDASKKLDTKDWKKYKSDTVLRTDASKIYRDAVVQDKQIGIRDFKWGRNYWYQHGIEMMSLEDAEVIDFTYTMEKFSLNVSPITELLPSKNPYHAAPLVTLKDKMHVSIGKPNVADKKYYDNEIQIDMDIDMVNVPTFLVEELLYDQYNALEDTPPMVFPIMAMFSLTTPSGTILSLLSAISELKFKIDLTITTIQRDETTHQELVHTSQGRRALLDSNSTQQDYVNYNKAWSISTYRNMLFLGTIWFSYYFNGVDFVDQI